VKHFCDLIAARQELFKTLWITWESARVQTWLKRVGCRNQYELTYEQYESFLRSLKTVAQSLLTRENRILLDQVEAILKDLGLNRKHPLVDDWLAARGVKDNGMTSDALRELHSLLKGIWEQKMVERIEEWERGEMQEPQIEEYRRAA
jgi:hypothetical protein